MTLYIGLMSGTSMDGIDAAIVDTRSNRLIHGITKKYSVEVQKRLTALLNNTHVSLENLCQLNTLIGRDFAAASNEVLTAAKLSATDIVAIGSHGQTVCHNTQGDIPYTLQLGCAHTIATLTGLNVVADFRTKDLVNGGQGAPFAPLYHQELFRQHNVPVAVVNVGGIANISFISPHEPTIGWDIGPGNCLMDAWIKLHLDKEYDASGAWALQGEVIEPLFTQLLADSFIRSAWPKSIGKEYFSLSWLAAYLKPEYKAVDVQHTLLAFTAQSISDTLIHSHTPVKALYLCGGGTHNNALLAHIARLTPGIEVSSIAALGIDPDYLEAMMFAWLAAQTMQKKAVDLTAITGSKHPQILGAVYYQ